MEMVTDCNAALIRGATPTEAPSESKEGKKSWTFKYSHKKRTSSIALHMLL